MTDWYETKNAKKIGFTGAVVGACSRRCSTTRPCGRNGANRDKTKASVGRRFPAFAKVTLSCCGDKQAATWRYTTEKPSKTAQADFNDFVLKEGQSGFRTRGRPARSSAQCGTRGVLAAPRVEIPADQAGGTSTLLHHDEDVEIYINGVLP